MQNGNYYSPKETVTVILGPYGKAEVVHVQETCAQF